MFPHEVMFVQDFKDKYGQDNSMTPLGKVPLVKGFFLYVMEQSPGINIGIVGPGSESMHEAAKSAANKLQAEESLVGSIGRHSCLFGSISIVGCSSISYALSFCCSTTNPSQYSKCSVFSTC